MLQLVPEKYYHVFGVLVPIRNEKYNTFHSLFFVPVRDTTISHISDRFLNVPVFYYKFIKQSVTFYNITFIGTVTFYRKISFLVYSPDSN